jgi:hypothetical protein
MNPELLVVSPLGRYTYEGIHESLNVAYLEWVIEVEYWIHDGKLKYRKHVPSTMWYQIGKHFADHFSQLQITNEYIVQKEYERFMRHLHVDNIQKGNVLLFKTILVVMKATPWHPEELSRYRLSSCLPSKL